MILYSIHFISFYQLIYCLSSIFNLIVISFLIMSLAYVSKISIIQVLCYLMLTSSYIMLLYAYDMPIALIISINAYSMTLCSTCFLILYEFLKQCY